MGLAIDFTINCRLPEYKFHLAMGMMFINAYSSEYSMSISQGKWDEMLVISENTVY